ncbi:hypothetical protein BV25DRAFT_1546202 [Artomyces pyxidatus]|uniref:Uncharacterized protein n=1 Tax=Artomyces pyxidatus TaxID=48021 RepID=A0ACB8SKD0_9AGAM|nr:hypothetical protein BV25DRAFT_1546202 [Artomyces pyxidatus]
MRWGTRGRRRAAAAGAARGTPRSGERRSCTSVDCAVGRGRWVQNDTSCAGFRMPRSAVDVGQGGQNAGPRIITPKRRRADTQCQSAAASVRDISAYGRHLQSYLIEDSLGENDAQRNQVNCNAREKRRGRAHQDIASDRAAQEQRNWTARRISFQTCAAQEVTYWTFLQHLAPIVDDRTAS